MSTTIPTDPRLADGPTIWELFARRVELTPDARMLLDERGRVFTFQEIFTWTERVAAGLAGRGIGRDTVVAWQLPTRIETFVLELALARLGATQLAIIHMYRRREVGFLLEAAKADWFVIPRTWRGFDFAAMAEEIRPHLGRSPQLLVLDDGLPEEEASRLSSFSSAPDEVRFIYSTSGTTSDPKAVLHTDTSLLTVGRDFADRLGLGFDAVNSLPFPIAHIGGPMQLILNLRYGLPCLAFETFSIPESMASLRKFHVTATGGSAAHFLMLLEQADTRIERPLPDLQVLFGGGAAKPPEVYWRVKKELGVEIRYGFGLTEAPVICYSSPDHSDEQRANTDGCPLPWAEVRIVDDDERPVSAGVDGEIQVRGSGVCKGYTDPELTRDAFTPDGFLRTGDRGFLRPDGHLCITGRSKETIIRKGENISAREVEDVLMRHPRVGAVAVIGLPDAERGEMVCAVVEPRAGMDPLLFDEMVATCKDAGLMIQKWPERLEILTELPRNPTLKVRKQELVGMFSEPAIARDWST